MNLAEHRGETSRHGRLEIAPYFVDPVQWIGTGQPLPDPQQAVQDF